MPDFLRRCKYTPFFVSTNPTKTNIGKMMDLSREGWYYLSVLHVIKLDNYNFSLEKNEKWTLP
jgi:hypothetical protein